mmetsp:Transcript_35377/g.113727  ORF Transcript_35377/g.113727 Transcript_35377/m.113727 type:complete len:322 (+) Transcript_35377:820-1785(+)
MVGVLFDFDGTLGDTEAPAMDVAFWELAPFMPSLELLATDPAGLDAARDAFVVENAGKAFEFMLEKVDAERAASGGLLPIEQAWARDLAACALTASPLAAAVDTQRAKLGLKTLADIFSASAAEPTLLAQQKADTNARLAIAATPTPNTPAALEALVKAGVPFVIATTSGKPRVPICVDACGFRAHFPSDDANIHSGESDFDPPRFKPAPDVYLRAASYVGGGGGLPPARCVAVEDSASGVGSAANAKIGLIVGYVGASHITDKDGHARVLMRGDRSEDGRGADVVLADMADLPAVVAAFGAGGVAAVRGASWVRLPSCSS